MGLRMRKGQGKIEVIACFDEIFDFLRKGYPVTRIHEDLKASGKVSASREQFARLVTKLVRPKVEKLALGPVHSRVEATQPSNDVQAPLPHHFPQSIHWDPTRKVEWK